MQSSSNRRSKTRVAPLFCTLAVGAFLSTLLSGCVFIHSSTIGESTGAGSAVSAAHSDYGILRLTKPQGLTPEVNADLVRQCPSGLLTDLQTQLSMRDWFLIVQYYTVTVNAVCKPPPPPPLAPPPPPPSAKQKLVLRGVHFDFNKYDIRPGDAAVLDEAITTLKANPNVTINVNGYCDAIGSEEYNLKLSERRANVVTNYLMNGGINVLQLRVHGYGKTNFVATNKTAEGRAQNRRVELVPNE
jgi:outer membrane protein OmpA-like peptidoglycan-associated protein